MRPTAALVLASLAGLACSPLVREDGSADAGGLQSASVIALNTSLALPGVLLLVSPNPVATSQKIFLRQDTSTPPNCTYGVFVADPNNFPVGDAGDTNNGLLLTALGDMNAINSDPALGGASRADCPDPSQYQDPIGGPIPDTVQPGQVLLTTGELQPYCQSFDTSTESCSGPVFPELAVGQVTDLGSDAGTPQPTPLLVDPSEIDDTSSAAESFAAMLLAVENVSVSDPHPDADTAVIVQPGNLWLDTLSPKASIPQVQGQSFTRVVGLLHYTTGHWRLSIRSQADLQL